MIKSAWYALNVLVCRVPPKMIAEMMRMKHIVYWYQYRKRLSDGFLIIMIERPGIGRGHRCLCYARGETIWLT